MWIVRAGRVVDETGLTGWHDFPVLIIEHVEQPSEN